MRKEEIRAQRLIQDFPDDSRGTAIKQLWKRQKRTDSVSLTIFLVLLLVIGFLIVSLVALYWPQEWDSSPITGLILLAAASTLFLFKSKVGRVWEWIKRKW